MGVVGLDGLAAHINGGANAEVDEPVVPIVVLHNVVRLDVAVDDAVLVQVHKEPQEFVQENVRMDISEGRHLLHNINQNCAVDEFLLDKAVDACRRGRRGGYKEHEGKHSEVRIARGGKKDEG